MRVVNRVLLLAGWMLVPAPPSGQSVEEMANVAEVHHPARGGRGVAWLRRVAALTPYRYARD